MVCGLSGSAYSRQLSFREYDPDIQSAVRRYWSDFNDWQYWKAQLFQESRLDPEARSPVGALGIAQFMPKTWIEVTQQIGLDSNHIPATHARHAIDAGAFYMRRLRKGWSAPRPQLDRHFLAAASYNAGSGNLLRAQKACGDKALYSEIIACLPQITGRHSQETITYVERIQRWRRELEAMR